MTMLFKEWVDAFRPRENSDDALPAPASSARLGRARFFIYRVKREDERHVPNARLHALLTEARKTYERYGDVPKIDEYDKKSAIYIGKAVYPVRVGSRQMLNEEWLSLRFIPAGGSPRYTEDLLVSRVGKKALLPILRRNMCNNEPGCAKRFVTLSRLCRIAPKRGKNRYTPQLFALMNRQFLTDAENAGATYATLTALLQPRLIDRALSVKGNRPPFVRAERTLRLKKEERLGIDRTLLSYRYPGYFLRMDELAKRLLVLRRRAA
jgi:hypothetical protein